MTKQNILEALKFIDENGVSLENQGTEYDLVTDDGKKYPPKYVIAVADNQAEISTNRFNSIEAKNFLENLGFKIESKELKRFTLSITANSVESTDNRFTMDDLGLGDNYEPVDETEIENKIVDHFSQCDNWTSLSIALTVFFVKHGLICSTIDVTKVLKKFEKAGCINIMLNPSTTTTGKPSAFMQEGKGKTVSVKWVR